MTFKIITIGTATAKPRFVAGPFSTREAAWRYIRDIQLTNVRVVPTSQQVQA